jgi:hypothetical protein
MEKSINFYSVSFGLDKQFQNIRNRVVENIKQTNKEEIIECNRIDFIVNICNIYSIDIPIIDFDNYETDCNPYYGSVQEFDMFSRQPYTTNKTMYKFEIDIPYTGNLSILENQPNEHRFISTSMTTLMKYDNKHIIYVVEIETIDDNVTVKVINDVINVIKNGTSSNIPPNQIGNYSRIINQIKSFNDSLYPFVERIFDETKKDYLNLGVVLNNPILHLKRKNIPSEQSIITPSPIRNTKLSKTVNIKPQYKSIIEYSNYMSILKMMFDFGQQLERTPDAYENRTEPSLRSLFIANLKTMYSDTFVLGEASNKAGKTDILIVHENNILFISECKKWSGIKGFMEAIDQLLSYLTDRDTKTSLLIFVDNKNIDDVSKTIKENIIKHTNYISEEKETNKMWLNYKFNLPSDNNNTIYLAVQLFHFN